MRVPADPEVVAVSVRVDESLAAQSRTISPEFVDASAEGNGDPPRPGSAAVSWYASLSLTEPARGREAVRYSFEAAGDFSIPTGCRAAAAAPVRVWLRDVVGRSATDDCGGVVR
jgi:hypothetical protein